jgi:hypothetical protein
VEGGEGKEELDIVCHTRFPFSSCVGLVIFAKVGRLNLFTVSSIPLVPNAALIPPAPLVSSASVAGGWQSVPPGLVAAASWAAEGEGRSDRAVSLGGVTPAGATIEGGSSSAESLVSMAGVFCGAGGAGMKKEDESRNGVVTRSLRLRGMGARRMESYHAPRQGRKD